MDTEFELTKLLMSFAAALRDGGFDLQTNADAARYVDAIYALFRQRTEGDLARNARLLLESVEPYIKPADDIAARIASGFLPH